MTDERDRAADILRVLQRLAGGGQFEDADLIHHGKHFIRWKDAERADDAEPLELVLEMKREGLIFFNPDTRQCEVLDKAREEYDLGGA